MIHKIPSDYIFSDGYCIASNNYRNDLFIIHCVKEGQLEGREEFQCQNTKL